MADQEGIPRLRLWRFTKIRALIVLIVFVLALRLVWGWWVGRQLAIQLDEIRRRGEPVEVTDVVYPPVPDSDNAWLLQAQAAQIVMASGVYAPRSSTLEYQDYPPYSQEWLKLAAASETAHARAFALARQARQRSAAQIRQNVTLPLKSMGINHLNPAKVLANTVADGAIFAHIARGDDAEAIGRLLDMLHISRSLRHDGFLVSEIVATGIDGMLCNNVQIIAPGLRFEPRSTTRPATRQQVRELIDRLIDEKSMQDGFRRSLSMERFVAIQSRRERAGATWIIRPLAARELVRLNPDYDLVVEASRCATNPQAQTLLNRCQWQEPHVDLSWFLGTAKPQPTVPRYSRWFSGLDAAVKYAFERYFWMVPERRAAALSLACQLYRADHGRLPEHLDQLVPTYLPALPTDPFHDDGRPLGYIVLKGKSPGGGDRPMTYFGAGDEDVVPSSPAYGWYSDPRPGRASIPTRQYRDLTRFIPPKSSKAVHDNPDETDAPGEEPQPENNAQKPEPE